MLSATRLYFLLLAASIRAQMQYRASFLMGAVGQFLITGIEIVGIWALFDRFGQLQQWSFPQVAFFYGTISIAFALGDALGTGFDRMASLVRGGEFDRILLRPRATVLQVLGLELALRRVGRLLQGVLVFTVALGFLEIPWTAGSVGLLCLTIFGGVCLFLGIFMVQGALTFWTTEALETVNAFSYGGVTAGQYPITIYEDWFRRFFTFVVPLACVSYLPLTLVLNVPDQLGVSPVLRALAPMAGTLFLLMALILWIYGVRKYKSTGS